MHAIHETRPVAGIGVGVIISCSGHRDQKRFAEYHVLLPRQNCTRISQRLSSTDEHFSEDLLLAEALRYAKDRLQNYVDERYLSHEIPFSPVELIATDDRTIRGLRYTGLCHQQLLEIARSTWSTELRELLDQVRHLPMISTTDIE